MNYNNNALELTSHVITLKSRKEMELSGVKKIESLNKLEFLISTTLGMLLIRGSELEMQQLDIEKGNLWITGNIDSLEYLIDKNNKQNKEGFFKKLFK